MLFLAASTQYLGDVIIGDFAQRVAFSTTAKTLSLSDAVNIGESSGQFLMKSAVVILTCGAFLALAVNIAQIGFQISPEAMRIDPTRLSPASGLKRIFSLRSLFRAFQALAKLLALSIVTAVLFQVHLGEIMRIGDTFKTDTVAFVQFCIYFGIVGGATMVVLSAVDLAYQRWQHEQDLMMTKQEMKEETKESEGSPHMKGHIRKVQREAAKLATLKEVASATVVVTNPTHFSVAIRYDRSSMNAPVVVSKGKGAFAKRIKRRAAESNVPIVENKPVARALYASTEIGSEIPTALYFAVAQIIAKVYGLR